MIRRTTVGGPIAASAVDLSVEGELLVQRDHFRIADLVWARPRGVHWYPGVILRIYDEETVLVMLLDDLYERVVAATSHLRFFTPDCHTVGMDPHTLLLQARQAKLNPLQAALPQAYQRAKEEYQKRLFFKKIGQTETVAGVTNDSVYDGPVPVVHGREQLKKWYMKTYTAIIGEMEQQDHQKWFRLPVTTTHNLPDYHKVVAKPMDFSTMRTKVRKGEYHGLDDFGVDLLLIFSNCVLYNGRGSAHGAEALRLQTFAQRNLHKAQEELKTIEREEAACNAAAEAFIKTFADPVRRQKVQPFLKAVSAPPPPIARIATIAPVAPAPAATDDALSEASRKRRREAETPHTALKVSSPALQVPEPLLNHLLAERDLFQSSGKSNLRLPKKVPAYNIMEWFDTKVPTRLGKDEATRQRVQEVGRGLLRNLNDACLKCLLYPPERAVYEKYIQGRPALAPDRVFGAEHLLRMVVHIPAHIRQTPVPDRPFILGLINELLLFLANNYARFFQQ